MNRMKENFNIEREECLIMGFKKDPADLKKYMDQYNIKYSSGVIRIVWNDYR